MGKMAGTAFVAGMITGLVMYLFDTTITPLVRQTTGVNV